MEEETRKRFEEQEELLNKVYVSVEKTRKYFLWTLISSLVVFVLPLIGLLFAIPRFLDIYTSGLEGL
jgi:hypothetical protein